MKQQSDVVRDLTEPGWRKREEERAAEFKRWCEAMRQQTPEERIAALEAENAELRIMESEAAARHRETLAELAKAHDDVQEHIALCLDANKLIDATRVERDAAVQDAERGKVVTVYRTCDAHAGLPITMAAQVTTAITVCPFCDAARKEGV